MELTEEQLAAMPPEDVRRLQKENCIFCHIVANRVASRKIYEDDKVLAVLDINPANPGHIILMPKEHYQIMPQLPDDDCAHLFMVAKALSHVCLRALKVEGTNIVVANGSLAGQKASHFMIHIIPRAKGDGIKGCSLPHRAVRDDESERMRAALSQRLAELLGIPLQELPAQNASGGNAGEGEASPRPEKPEQKAATGGQAPAKREPKEREQKGEHDLDAVSRVLLGR